MSTATAPRQTTQGQQRPAAIDEKSLLEQVICLPIGEKVKQMDAALMARVSEIEALLPDFMKGQGERLIKRARLTFGSSEKLQNCSPASFVKCVLQAAELGFAIDGKLCHAVPYNNKKKDSNGKEYWIDEASCQVDYKGMLAVAKRLLLVQDAWARRVHVNDLFQMDEHNGKTSYRHTFDPKAPRGDVIGVFAVATNKDDWFRLDWMTIEDIYDIRGRSKSYQSFAKHGYSCPWTTDAGEMEKKTVLKRLLKTFSDDPGLARLLEIDNEDYVSDHDEQPGRDRRGPRKIEEFAAAIAPQVTQSVASTVTEELPDSSYEPTDQQDIGPDDDAPDGPKQDPWDQFAHCVKESKHLADITSVSDHWLPKFKGTPREAESVALVRERETKIREGKGKSQKTFSDTAPTA